MYLLVDRVSVGLIGLLLLFLFVNFLSFFFFVDCVGDSLLGFYIRTWKSIL